MLYSSVYWKASTDLAAIVLSFSLAAKSWSSFSRVSLHSVLRSSLKVLAFYFKVLASSMMSMSFFFSVEFSFSKASILDVRDATLAFGVRYSEAIWRLSPNT